MREKSRLTANSRDTVLHLVKDQAYLSGHFKLRQGRLAGKKDVPSNPASFTCYRPAWLSAYLVRTTTRTSKLSPEPTLRRGLCSATRGGFHIRHVYRNCQFLLRTRKFVPGSRQNSNDTIPIRPITNQALFPQNTLQYETRKNTFEGS